MRLIAIDPGAHSGIAVFEDGLLTQAYNATFEKPETWYRGAADVIFTEEPYGSDKGGKSSFSDLAELMKRACEMSLLIAIRSTPWAERKWVRPQTWKGGVDKQITFERVMFALSHPELDALERCLAKTPKTLQYNVTDSVGIGLWTMGRYR